MPVIHPPLLRFTVNDIDFDMLHIEGDTFRIGSDKLLDPDAFEDESPIHDVNIKPFYMGELPVTHALWTTVTGETPSYFSGGNRPVEQVSWDDIKGTSEKTGFLDLLNRMTAGKRPPGTVFRLPSEAEWEFAARGGKYRLNGKYAGSNKLGEVAFYAENSHNETKTAGMKFPNELGLYDMTGNVWEWCEDDWHGDYNDAPDDGTAWIGTENRGGSRVYRGGGWANDPRYCRVACRDLWYPGARYLGLGFRVALAPSSKESPSGSL